MTFLLLWWAASRPVETCWVTLDVESTHASLSLRQREWRWRPSLSTCHTHIQTHTHTVLCSIASSFCQTRIPDMIWNTVSPPLLPSCHASDVEGNQGVCTCWQGSVYACVYMHVNVTTPTEGMYKISLYTFRLLYAQYVSWLCVCWVSYINICTCILCVCVCVRERERERSFPSNLQTFWHPSSLFTPGLPWSRLEERAGVLAPCPHNIAVSWPTCPECCWEWEVALDSWHPSFFFPYWSYLGGKPEWSLWAHKTSL